jgi:hypothetical protein
MIKLVMNRKVFLAGLSFVVLVLVIVRISNMNKVTDNVDTGVLPTEAMPTEVIEAENMVTEPEAEVDEDGMLIYRNEDLGFLIRHPANLNPEDQGDGSIGIILVGPTQTDETEFFDGIVLGFQQSSLEGKSLAEKVEEDVAMYKEVIGDDEISQVSSVSIGGVLGLKFSDYRGEFLYLPQGEDKYLEVVNFTADPGNLGYKEIAKAIIESIEIL